MSHGLCCRDELKQCRSKIAELEAEREDVRDELINKESAGNQYVLAVFSNDLF